MKRLDIKPEDQAPHRTEGQTQYLHERTTGSAYFSDTEKEQVKELPDISIHDAHYEHRDEYSKAISKYQQGIR